MAVLTIRDILRGQTTLDTIILRRQTRAVSAKPNATTPFKYVFIPSSYLSPASASDPDPDPIRSLSASDTSLAPASASASGVQPTITPPLIVNKDDNPNTPFSFSSSSLMQTETSTTPTPVGYLCHVLPHERLYDLGRKENWRRMMRMPLFDTWSSTDRTRKSGEALLPAERYVWPRMNDGVLERMVRDLR